MLFAVEFQHLANTYQEPNTQPGSANDGGGLGSAGGYKDHGPKDKFCSFFLEPIAPALIWALSPIAENLHLPPMNPHTL